MADLSSRNTITFCFSTISDTLVTLCFKYVITLCARCFKTIRRLILCHKGISRLQHSQVRKTRCYMWCFKICSTVLRCQTLFPPLNGFLVGDCDNSFGFTCQMNCKDGYNLLGSKILTCLHKPGHLTGYWDGTIPSCKSKQQIVRKRYVFFFPALNPLTLLFPHFFRLVL